MIPAVIYFLILSPVFVLILSIPFTSGLLFDGEVLLPTFIFSITQATLSALLSVVAGFLCAPAYAALRSRSFQSRFARLLFGFVKATLVLPNVMSPLLVTTALLVAVPDFPFGWVGVLLGHFYFSVGLSTVQLGENWWELKQTSGVVAESLGGGTLFNLFKIYAPLMAKNIFQSWVFIFSICFSSFYIPLVFGGGHRFLTLEAMIYEQLRSSGNVAGALGVSLIQMASQFLIMLMVWRVSMSRNEKSFDGSLFKKDFSSSTPLLEKISLPFLGVMVGFILIPLFSILKTAAHASDFSFMSHFWPALINTSIISFVASLLVVAALLTIFASRSENIFRFVPTVSGVLVGLACVLGFGASLYSSSWLWYLASIFGLFVSYLGFFYRGAAGSLIDSKRRYQNISSSLGAGTLFQIKTVYIPANIKVLVGVFVLCFCWCIGDVSVLSFTAPSESTLTLLLRSLQGSYRLEEASVVSLVLILASAAGIFALGYLESGKNSKSGS